MLRNSLDDPASSGSASQDLYATSSAKRQRLERTGGAGELFVSSGVTMTTMNGINSNVTVGTGLPLGDVPDSFEPGSDGLYYSTDDEFDSPYGAAFSPSGNEEAQVASPVLFDEDGARVHGADAPVVAVPPQPLGGDAGELHVVDDEYDAPVAADHPGAMLDKAGKFKMNQKKIFCTWSSVYTGEYRVGVAEEFCEKLEFNGFAIEKGLFALEPHAFNPKYDKPGEKRWHVHACIVLKERPNRTSVTCLDVFFEGKAHHPNILKLMSGHWKYLLDPGKKKKVIDPTPFFKGITLAEIIAGSKAGALLAAESLEDFKKLLVKHFPLECLKFGATMEANWKRYGAGARPDKDDQGPAGPYPKHFYPVPEWDNKKRSLLIHGLPGGQKSSFAQYYMRHHCKVLPFTLCGDINALRPFSLATHGGLIFDDFDFTDGFPDAFSRSITDVEATVDVRVLYGTVEIPKGTPRIFTSNDQFPFRNPGEAVYGRRVQSWYVGAPGDPQPQGVDRHEV